MCSQSNGSASSNTNEVFTLFTLWSEFSRLTTYPFIQSGAESSGEWYPPTRSGEEWTVSSWCLQLPQWNIDEACTETVLESWFEFEWILESGELKPAGNDWRGILEKFFFIAYYFEIWITPCQGGDEDLR